MAGQKKIEEKGDGGRSTTNAMQEFAMGVIKAVVTVVVAEAINDDDGYGNGDGKLEKKRGEESRQIYI